MKNYKLDSSRLPPSSRLIITREGRTEDMKSGKRLSQGFFFLKVHCASEGFCVGNEGLKEGGGLGVLGGEGTASLVRWHC